MEGPIHPMVYTTHPQVWVLACIHICTTATSAWNPWPPSFFFPPLSLISRLPMVGRERPYMSVTTCVVPRTCCEMPARGARQFGLDLGLVLLVSPCEIPESASAYHVDNKPRLLIVV